MHHRLPGRLLIILMVVARLWRHLLRKPPTHPQRILIAHNLLLGDTLLLTPLLAKLRQQYPLAEIHLTVRKTVAPLYEKQPYGVTYLVFEPKSLLTHIQLLKQGPYDLALIPGDNRYSWLAYAMGARWIVAFDGDRPTYKSWLVDELRTYPNEPAAWSDINTHLLKGNPPAPFHPSHWPMPNVSFIQPLPDKYVVLHVGASSVLKLWPLGRWEKLAKHINQAGFSVVWSGGPGEEKYIQHLKPLAHSLNTAGKLNLAQMWHLLKHAAILVCPDTGIAHMARITQTPTICLFGPGSVQVHGKSNFWHQDDYYPLSTNIACRNQPYLFKRELPWVQRCGRNTNECKQAKCMQDITLEQVLDCFDQFIH